MSDVKFIFNSHNKTNAKKEFSSSADLRDYIRKYDFFRRYDAQNNACSATRGEEKSFCLSAVVKVKLNDFNVYTKVGEGQYSNENFEFYIGEKVEIIPNTDKIKVTVLNFPQNITDELYEEYTIGRNSCVIDNKTLRQIYPECMNPDKTRLNQFINMVKSMKGNLEKVK